MPIITKPIYSKTKRFMLLLSKELFAVDGISTTQGCTARDIAVALATASEQ